MFAKQNNLIVAVPILHVFFLYRWNCVLNARENIHFLYKREKKSQQINHICLLGARVERKKHWRVMFVSIVHCLVRNRGHSHEFQLLWYVKINPRKLCYSSEKLNFFKYGIEDAWRVCVSVYACQIVNHTLGCTCHPHFASNFRLMSFQVTLCYDFG